MSRDRLITNKDKKSWRCGSFTPYAERAGYAEYADYAGHTMYAGYEAFPKIFPYHTAMLQYRCS